MNRLFTILLLSLLGTPVLSGVGDVYYCYLKGDFVQIIQLPDEKNTVIGTEQIKNKFTMKWEKDGISGLYKDRLVKFKASSVWEEGESFVTEDIGQTTGCCYSSIRYVFTNGQMVQVIAKAELVEVSFAQCEKY